MPYSNWLRYLPIALRTKIEHRPDLQKVIVNAGWLFGDRILRLLIGLFVGAWVARYLGPEMFGALNYALAMVGMFGAIANLGINSIVVRDLVRNPQDAHVTLGTAFILQLVGGILAFLLAVLAVGIVRPGDELIKTMVAVLGFALVFKATDVVKYWFESQVQSRHTIIVENVTMMFMAVVRVALIFLKVTLMAFVWAMFAEAAIVAIFLLAIYTKRIGSIHEWGASRARARSLLTEGWPVILVSVASMINMRMDQLMLGKFTSDIVVGNFAAAVRIAEIWLTIPMVIGPSIFPGIIAAKKAGDEIYRKRILKITGYMAVFTIPVAVLIMLTSGQIVHLLYGAQFEFAGTYLSLLIWSGVPYMIFFAVSQMFFIEGMVKHSFYVSLIAIVSNVSLNLLLIPKYGGYGAALATMVTGYVATLVTLVLINSKTSIFFKFNGVLEKKI